MKILLVTDTWEPTVNGVVTTIRYLVQQLKLTGHAVVLIHPGLFPNLPLFCHKEVRVVVTPWRIFTQIQKVNADATHIFTEGPLGISARLYCGWKNIPFTTSYHTRFPEFAEIYLGIPHKWIYLLVNWFHSKATRTLVPTVSMIKILTEKLPSSKNKLTLWTRGVDRSVFNPSAGVHPTEFVRQLFLPKRPTILCVSRLDKEKGIDDFCHLPNKFTKILVGDGCERRRLESKFAESVIFTGYKHGKELASIYALADCVVFPSLVDTFGNVMVEAMACGTPVAAYKITGPQDVITQDVSGYMAEIGDRHALCRSVEACLNLDSIAVQRCSFKWDVKKCCEEFLSNLEPITANTHQIARI